MVYWSPIWSFVHESWWTWHVMPTIASCQSSSSIETSMCLLDFICGNYIAIYSKPQEWWLITKNVYLWGFHCASIGYHVHGKERMELLQAMIGPQRTPSTYIRRWREALTNHWRWRTNRDAACFSLRGNVHKEPARVFTDGVSWCQPLCRSSSLLFWEKVWSSQCSIETVQIFSKGTMV